MRKLTVLFIILLSAAGVLQAQKGTAVKNMGKAVTKSSGKGSAGAMVKTPKGPRNLPTTGRVRAGSVVAPAQGNTQSRALTNPQTVRTDATTLVPQAYTGVAKVGVLSSKEGQAAILDKAKQQAKQVEELVTTLEKRAELQQQKWNNFFETGIGKSVLFAPLMSSREIGYSVTVFKTQYQGKEEIFGVMPSHALPNDFSHRFDSVGKNFQVAVKQADGTSKMLQAKVVQVSPQSMLDISLVKFEPQDETLLRPLLLAEDEAQLNEILFSYGFAAGKETAISRSVNALSFLSVRTNQAIEGAREGFCGSPLLDANGRIKAIHTGTVEGSNGKEDVSYGTHVTFIRKLVEAYHNEGQASYPLLLQEEPVAQLQVDEYISAFYLYDENGKKLIQQNIDGKFSQSTILKALKSHPQASYLQLTSRKAQWVQETDMPILKENRQKTDKTKRQHWYNLQTKQIEPARPAVIKM